MAEERSFNPLEADLLSSIRLEASAGTGKTYNLERVVCELISRYRIPLNQILVVTFTNKATRELRERIRSILTDQSGEVSGKDPQQRELLLEARHNFDKAAIFTIHGFCQHVLQTYPFESGSAFQQEFLSDHSLVEEGVRDYLYSRFRRICPEDRELIRGFLKGSGNLDEAVGKLVKITMDELDSPGVIRIPDDKSLERALEEMRSFSRGEGPVKEALGVLKTLSWKGPDIFQIFRTLKTRQKEITAEKIAAVLEALPRGEDLAVWLDWFFGKQEDPGGVPASLLLNLYEPFLREKCGKNLSPPDFPDLSLVNAVTDLFSALEPFYDPESPDKGIHRKILGYAFIREVVKGALPLIEDKKKIRGMRDFPDLIKTLHNSLTEDPDGPLARILRQQYRVVLVDEFQDTDRMQWDIFRTLFGRDKDHNLFLIGDPKQSIYGFRGADLSVYFEACDSISEENRFSLGTNFRSRAEVVQGCNYLFQRLFSLPVKGSLPIPFQPVEAAGLKGAFPRDGMGNGIPAITFCEIESGSGKEIESREQLKKAWMNEIVFRIEDLLSSGYTLELKGEPRQVQPGDLAVLMDTNGDCETLQTLLEACGVSSVIYSDRRVLDSDEADLFGLFFKCLAFPSDRSSLRALLISPVFSLSAADLSEMEESGELDEFSLGFHEWKNHCDQGGLIRVFHSLFERENLIPGRVGDSWKNRLLRLRSGDRSCTNLQHLAELFHQEQRDRSLDAHGLYDLFIKMKNDPSPDDQKQVRLDKDGQAVQILTHHSSKGLEYPIVFFSGGLQDGGSGNRSELTFYWDGKRYRDYLLTGDSRKKAALSDWEERKRLYYVSLTRASSLLFMPFFPQIDFCYLTSLYGALCGEKLLKEAAALIKPLPMQDHWPYHSDLKWIDRKGMKQKKAAFNGFLGDLLQEVAGQHSQLFRFAKSRKEELSHELRVSDEKENAHQGPSALQCAEWKGGRGFYDRIIPVDSFSSLTAGAHGLSGDTAGADPDADRDGGDTGEIPPEESTGALGLTRGAEFGNLVHFIFENINFSWGRLSLEEWFENGLFGPSEPLLFLEEAVLRFFDQDWWRENFQALGEMIWNVLNCPLEKTGPLKFLKEPERKAEIEFLFRIPGDSRIRMAEWTKNVREGYLKGFIDLVFLHKGKYYIADWKTTVPSGDGVLGDYEAFRLEETMHTHLYDVQARIYIQALVKHLKNLNSRFDYQRDFGGVYYFFVRGMSCHNSTRGVYFVRPDQDELENFLKRELG